MSFKSDSAMPVDQDGKKISYTGIEVYVDVLESLHTWMRANNLAIVLETEPRQIPKSPSARVLRHVKEDRARSHERKQVSDWIKDQRHWKSVMLRGIDAFVRILTPNMRIYLREQGKDLTIGSRDNYQDLEETIRQRYATWTDERGSLNYFTAQSMAPFTSLSTALAGLKELDDLRRERVSWGEPDQI